MKSRIALGLLFFCYSAFSQTNLVPNSDFEFFTSCPTSVDQIILAEPWFQPRIFSSTDYYNLCNPSWVCGVPLNVGGFQYAHSGEGYSGIILYQYNSSGYREYIEVELLETLAANNKYCLELYVSLGNNSPITPGIISVNSLGVFFSPDSVLTDTFINLPYTPQINFDSYGMLSDTSSWMKLEGEFTASGGENFLTIGNFRSDENTDTLILINDNTSLAYYFIDDVSLYHCGYDTIEKPLKIPNVFSPNNDGVNDLFIIENLPENSEVKIYNRWGALIYEWLNSNGSWDGRTKAGAEINGGVYYYIISLPDGNKKKGFIEVVK